MFKLFKISSFIPSCIQSDFTELLYNWRCVICLELALLPITPIHESSHSIYGTDCMARYLKSNFSSPITREPILPDNTYRELSFFNLLAIDSHFKKMINEQLSDIKKIIENYPAHKQAILELVSREFSFAHAYMVTPDSEITPQLLQDLANELRVQSKTLFYRHDYTLTNVLERLNLLMQFDNLDEAKKLTSLFYSCVRELASHSSIENITYLFKISAVYSKLKLFQPALESLNLGFSLLPKNFDIPLLEFSEAMLELVTHFTDKPESHTMFIKAKQYFNRVDSDIFLSNWSSSLNLIKCELLIHDYPYVKKHILTPLKTNILNSKHQSQKIKKLICILEQECISDDIDTAKETMHHIQESISQSKRTQLKQIKKLSKLYLFVLKHPLVDPLNTTFKKLKQQIDDYKAYLTTTSFYLKFSSLQQGSPLEDDEIISLLKKIAELELKCSFFSDAKQTLEMVKVHILSLDQGEQASHFHDIVSLEVEYKETHFLANQDIDKLENATFKELMMVQLVEESLDHDNLQLALDVWSKLKLSFNKHFVCSTIVFKFIRYYRDHFMIKDALFLISYLKEDWKWFHLESLALKVELEKKELQKKIDSVVKEPICPKIRKRFATIPIAKSPKKHSTSTDKMTDSKSCENPTPMDYSSFPYSYS